MKELGQIFEDNSKPVEVASDTSTSDTIGNESFVQADSHELERLDAPSLDQERSEEEVVLDGVAVKVSTMRMLSASRPRDGLMYSQFHSTVVA